MKIVVKKNPIQMKKKKKMIKKHARKVDLINLVKKINKSFYINAY